MQSSSDTQKQNMRIVLASASPRRKEILAAMGASFEIITSDADESSDITDPILLTKELSSRKGMAVYKSLVESDKAEGAVIISADTVVECRGKILGKPHTRQEAFEMLSDISGKTHRVVSGVSVIFEGKLLSDCSVTEVTVVDVPPEEIEKYIDSGEPFDKAGGYGIQGGFCQWVSEIRGCYFGVVGLSASTTARLVYELTGKYPKDIK